MEINERMETCEIYIYLEDEGVDVWRPVRAKKLNDNKYEIIGIQDYDSNDEK
jgi:hypothetical protein